MPNNCASCEHPQVREINHRIREDRPLTDISRWLASLGTPITRQALARHAKGHLGTIPTVGRRPVSGDFLTAVRDAAYEGLESGELTVTLKDGVRAQQLLDVRENRDADRDLVIKIAMALSGASPLQLAAPVDPLNEEIEGEFRLLSSGAE